MMLGTKVRLREKRLTDARNDYRWQIDPDLVQLDAMPQLTISFPRYLLDYSAVLHNPSPKRHAFAIETIEGRHIGNCVYYNIDREKGEAELGIMIGEDDCWDKGYGADAVATLVDHIFNETDLQRIYLKTLDWNQRAQHCFGKCGFTPCGQLVKNGQNFVLMEMKKEHWQKEDRASLREPVS
ncbi:MAG TPA: GNAT family N-acetyltransferase [Dehalococcoidia bacterium]|nr:GNAT family N-acetyltransferase [Dehalococcoidia bacterium]